jgi:NAD(P)H-quinone oxidoreductase subunit 5
VINSVDNLALIGYLAPLILFLAAFQGRLQPGRRPHRVLWASRAATWTSLVLSLLAAAAVFAFGPLVSPVIGRGDFGLSIRLDALSVVMFWLVAFVGVLVVQFSRNYLDGDGRHGAFLGGLCLTIGAVILLVLAGNLFQLVLAWIGTSLALHQLLVFYADRPGAVAAARKKFIVARAGDICLVIAAVLFTRAFGTGDLGALRDAAGAALEAGLVPAGVGWAAVLVAVAAALKSAMFPFHGWLLEVMETPTPVSALLHAGLINAGTFLVVRLGELMFLYPPALHVLMIVGGFTALFASVAMITQSSVKVSLAYSSAAHMGFMLMLCGFGAHSVAILHLVAHSFYKAHAFLSSGSIVEYVRGVGARQIDATPRPLRLLVSLAAALVIFVGIGALLGVDVTKRPGETALGAIFVMAITHLLVKGFDDAPHIYVITRTALAAAAVTLAFFGLELTAAWILADAVVAFPQPTVSTLVVMVLVVLTFALVTVLQTQLPALVHSPAWRVAYVHLKNGLYANALFDRLIGALR